MPELLIILFIILIIFGAGKLPEIGSGLGKGIRALRQSTSEEKSENTSSPEDIKVSSHTSKE